MNPVSLPWSLLQALMYLAIAPLVVGVLEFTQARMQRRRGAPSLRLYVELWQLFHRRDTQPKTASWLFQAAPVLFFMVYLAFGFVTPLFYLPRSDGLILSIDVMAILALIGLGRFTLFLAGIDSGSPLGGMGGARSLFLFVIELPALVLAFFAFSLDAKTSSLSGILAQHAALSTFDLFLIPSFWMALAAFVLAMMIEIGRLPLDNAGGQGADELMMVEKAVWLEYSGPGLALFKWGAALRLTFFLSLTANLVFPAGMISPGTSLWLGLAAPLVYLVKLLGCVLLLAVSERLFNTRLHLKQMFFPASMALVFGILAVFFAVLKIRFS